MGAKYNGHWVVKRFAPKTVYEDPPHELAEAWLNEHIDNFTLGAMSTNDGALYIVGVLR